VAKLLVDLGFDGIDINMGCPVKKVINQSSCSDLIRHPQLAQEIILATKEGARGLPVSVKTRIGFGKIEVETWIPALLETSLAAITVHLRTVKEMSKVPAHWEVMPEIMEIVNSRDQEIRPIILGNGDVMTLAEAEEKVVETGCDGVMIGRGIFGNPWLFDRTKQVISISERMRSMLEHTKLFEKMYCGISAGGGPTSVGKNFEVMKKHYKAYVNGFDGAKELRIKLMASKDFDEVEQIILEQYPILKERNLA
jgi:tRNA-dihydrouridine synthase